MQYSHIFGTYVPYKLKTFYKNYKFKITQPCNCQLLYNVAIVKL